MGLASEATTDHKKSTKTRYFRHSQAPRLHLRRDWVQTRIEKEAGTFNQSDSYDPYHSYFEYYYDDNSNPDGEVLRGVSANVLKQDHAAASSLHERRARSVSHESDVKDNHHDPASEVADEDGDGNNPIQHRRLQQVDVNPLVEEEKTWIQDSFHEGAQGLQGAQAVEDMVVLQENATSPESQPESTNEKELKDQHVQTLDETARELHEGGREVEPSLADKKTRNES